MKLTIFTDGACSGNPGPAGVGVLIKQGDRVLKEVAQFMGQATNNRAEYTALIVALKQAKDLGATEVDIYSDSELMCRQVAGKYIVRDEMIKALFDEVKELKRNFKKFTLTHVRREQNKEADALSRRAIKNAGRDGCPDADGVGEESPSSTG